MLVGLEGNLDGEIDTEDEGEEVFTGFDPGVHEVGWEDYRGVEGGIVERCA